MRTKSQAGSSRKGHVARHARRRTRRSQARQHGSKRDLIRRDARAREAPRHWTQQVLELGLQFVDRDRHQRTKEQRRQDEEYEKAAESVEARVISPTSPPRDRVPVAAGHRDQNAGDRCEAEVSVIASTMTSPTRHRGIAARDHAHHASPDEPVQQSPPAAPCGSGWCPAARDLPERDRAHEHRLRYGCPSFRRFRRLSAFSAASARALDRPFEHR